MPKTLENGERIVMPYSEAIAAYRHKIEEEILLHGATKWRTSEEEQIWSGLGINTHAYWSVQFMKDIEYDLECEHDKITNKYAVLHRWVRRKKE